MNLKRYLTEKTKSAFWGDCDNTPDGPLYFRDKGASVLAVCHLDYVLWETPTKRGSVVYCPQLDDRLGAWVIAELLPDLGVNVDCLFTTGEENARSTGTWFEPTKSYNWVAEFDRAGTDVVFYQYQEFAKQWRGWKRARGSFSDISMMYHLGVMCANVGIGYHRQHSWECWANLADTTAQAQHFAEFRFSMRQSRKMTELIG